MDVGTIIQSVDYQGRLYVSKTTSGDYFNEVWVCDYNRILLDESTGKYLPQWYLLNNIAAKRWIVIDGELHFLTRDGSLKRFKTDSDLLPYEDDQEGDIENPALPSKYEFYRTTLLNNHNTIQVKEAL